MKRILIADDSDILRSRLAELINEIDTIEIISQAKNVPETIKQAETLSPDIVILDIRMPGENGISAINSLKRLTKPPVIIIFTNYPYLAYRKSCLNAGADYFFLKQ